MRLRPLLLNLRLMFITAVVVALVFTLYSKKPTIQQEAACCKQWVETHPYAKADIAPRDLTASLVNELPDSTIAYLRLPRGLLASTESSNRLIAHLSNAQVFRDTHQQVMDGFAKVITDAFPKSSPFVELLSNVDHPIELAVIPSSSSMGFPDTVIRLGMTDTTPKQLDQWWNTILNNHDLSSAANATFSFAKQGKAQLTFDDQSGMPLTLGAQWQAPHLTLVFNVNNPGDALFQSLEQLATRAQPHPLQAKAQSLQQTPNGFALWLDIAGMKSHGGMLGMALSVSTHNPIAQHLEQVFVGESVAENYGRFFTTITFNDQLDLSSWVGADLPNLTAVGPTRYVLSAALPSPELLQTLSPETKNFDTWRIISEGLGQQITLTSDHLGSYLVANTSNKKAFKTLTDFIENKTPIQRSEPRGQDIYHANINVFDWFPALENDMANNLSADFSGLEKKLMQLWFNQNLYWTHQDDTTWIHTVPQPLMERHSAIERLPVTWPGLNTRDTDAVNILYASARTEDVGRRVYHYYLRAWQSLSQMVDTPIDLTQFPSATDLGLDGDGMIGFRISRDKHQLHAELLYHQTPMDALHSAGSSLLIIGGVGVLAAIAVPAYQDYTKRAALSEALIDASQVKIYLAEATVALGRLPTRNELYVLNEEIQPELDFETDHDIEIDIETGDIVITYSAEQTGRVLMHDRQTRLTPHYQDNSQLITWTCSSTLPDSWVPANCRN